jgi:hypothetical protein
MGEKIIWNFDNVQKAYATRGYEAKVGSNGEDGLSTRVRKNRHQVLG